jgi:hypothetical protein
MYQVGSWVGQRAYLDVVEKIKVCFLLASVVVVQQLFVSLHSGVGGLEVACWPLVPKFAGSHTAEAVGFLGRKIRSRGSKPVGPMSYLYGM